MSVGKNDIADRQGRPRTDCRAQALAIGETAARIEHSDGFPARYEPDIGNCTFVGRGGVLVDAATKEYAARNFLQRRVRACRRERAERADAPGGECAEHGATSRERRLIRSEWVHACHLDIASCTPNTVARNLPFSSSMTIDDTRLDQMMRWHGTDETNLPPADTLKNLARDTVAALAELRAARAQIAGLRAAMGEAFWANTFRSVHEILLTALGPPPEDPPEP
jgi:hypothetical protein